MAFKHKYSYKEKEHILIEYLNGHDFRELCHIYGMSQEALKDWIRLLLKKYKIHTKRQLRK